jgi:hypothetical protein
MAVRGRLYAFLYQTQRRTFLGFSLAGWLKNLPLLLLLIAWLLEGPTPLLLLALALAFLMRLLYAFAERAGFVTFVPDTGMSLAEKVKSPADNRQIEVCATGTFAVHEREAYLLLRPATYWRMPLGEHVIMVEEKPGRFLYQFLRAETVQRLRPGHLLFGTRPQIALAIQFLSAWGPDAATPGKAYFVGGDGEPAAVKRTVYLTFAHEDERQAVWRNLLRDAATDGQYE